MTKNPFFFLALCSLVLLASCNGRYQKTPSGILYKIISTGNNAQVARGQILKFHYSQKLNDSSMFSTAGSLPAYAKVDSVGPIYSPLEVLQYLHKGDSAIIVQLADSLLKKMPPGQPSPIKKNDKITLTIKVVDVLKSDEMAQADQIKEMKSEGERETSNIQNYLSSKKISTQKTQRGVFVAVQSQGDGPAVDSGKFVSVNYTGKSFPSAKVNSEKVFESNVGKSPIQFVINSGQVIPGWDEGLKLLKKGGKATLYIPATLAYGQQAGPGGKPFENLIFDVEVVDVADKAPAPKPNLQMPNAQMQTQENPSQQGSTQRNSGNTNPNPKK